MSEDDLRKALWAIPHSERLAMLVISILQDEKNDPALSVRNMVKATTVIAQYLNQIDRFRIAEKLRDAADQLEHRQKVVVS